MGLVDNTTAGSSLTSVIKKVEIKVLLNQFLSSVRKKQELLKYQPKFYMKVNWKHRNRTGLPTSNSIISDSIQEIVTFVDFYAKLSSNQSKMTDDLSKHCCATLVSNFCHLQLNVPNKRLTIIGPKSTWTEIKTHHLNVPNKPLWTEFRPKVQACLCHFIQPPTNQPTSQPAI